MSEHDFENLAEAFLEHAEKTRLMQEHTKEKWRENYPGAEMPEHFKSTFNLSTALHVMCNEIQKLKDVSAL